MLLTSITEEMKAIVEAFVRKTLGQDLSKEYLPDEQPEHLRFDMSGNRDSNEGDIANEKIWALFEKLNYHLDIRSSYNDDRPASADFVFTFHKGHGYLYRVDEKSGKWRNNLVESYGGIGTVEILTDLLLRFSINSCIDKMRELTK